MGTRSGTAECGRGAASLTAWGRPATCRKCWLLRSRRTGSISHQPAWQRSRWLRRAQRGCGNSGGGAFDPGPVCGGVDPDASPRHHWARGVPAADAALPRSKPGEPPGRSADGKVCTLGDDRGRDGRRPGVCRLRQLRSRPHAARSPRCRRLPEFQPSRSAHVGSGLGVGELGWVKSRSKPRPASAATAPRRPRALELVPESPGNFINSFYDTGIAEGAGWITSLAWERIRRRRTTAFRAPRRSIPTTASSRPPTTRMRRFEAERRCAV